MENIAKIYRVFGTNLTKESFSFHMRELNDRVIIDPEIMDGEPVIKNTRVPVKVILRTHAEGVGIDSLCTEFGLQEDQVLDAIKFAAELIEEENGPSQHQDPKFLLAEDLPNSAMKPFEENGFEAVHVRNERLEKALDREMYADKEDCILVTREKSSIEPEKGVIMLEIDSYAPKALKNRLNEFLKEIDLESIEGDKLIIEDESHYRSGEKVNQF